MKFFALLLIVLSGVATAAVSQTFARKQSDGSIEGRWKIINRKAERKGFVAVWEITRSEVIVWLKEGAKAAEEITRFTYSIDMAKSPHWITLDIDDSLDGHGNDKRHGIFRIENGELHTCLEFTDGGTRPTDFEGRVTRYKRVLQDRNAEHGEKPKP